MAKKRGTKGDDSVLGGSAADVISGLAGDDMAAPHPPGGGRGGHHILGGPGNDRLIGGSGADYIKGNAGNDVLIGGIEKDILRAGTGSDRLIGGSGEDWLLGNDGDDWLDGGSHPDYLIGGRGNDVLIGGSHADVLTGDGPDDVDHYTVPGGTIGSDDVFLFRSLAEASGDLITDFKQGEDVLDFSALGGGLVWSTTTDGVRTYLDLSHDGQTATVTLAGVLDLTGDDFIL